MWENLSKPEYQHILLNHFPLVGLAVSALGLLIVALLKQTRAVVVSLVLVALCAGSFWPVMETGEEGEDRVQSLLYNEGQDWLHYHHHLADTWAWVYFATAAVALIGAVVVLVRPQITKWTVGIVLLLSAGSLTAGAFIAEAGGKIQHKEFRDGPPPKIAGHGHSHDD